MDATIEYLSDYACRLSYEDLSPDAVHQVKRTLVDTLGCGAGALDGEPASIARHAASRVRGNPPARILGSAQQTSMDLAAFANTVLVRYLDCNDTYAARGTGHPSDMIPAVLAVADGHKANGRAVPDHPHELQGLSRGGPHARAHRTRAGATRADRGGERRVGARGDLRGRRTTDGE